jgi:acetoin utilization deacetylase AcuC-like enzyme
MRIIHHPGYDPHFGQQHVFPSVKFQMVRDRLLGDCIASEADLLRPDPASNDDLLLVHTPAWVDALTHGTLTHAQIVRLEVPYSQAMVRAFRLMAGGSILAAQLALQDGVAYNCGGGFHHAFPGHGEGFCAVNDVAVAIRALQRSGRITRAMVIDCDVHHGNGTAAVFADDPTVFTISLHQFKNYPAVKPPSNVDVHLNNGTGDQDYVSILRRVCERTIQDFAPQLLFYVAGADPYEEDQLGGLALTRDGLAERDRVVISTARGLGVPVAITLAGGYAQYLEDTVAIHAATAQVAHACLR